MRKPNETYLVAGIIVAGILIIAKRLGMGICPVKVEVD
jgi:hypothetical protein